MNGEVSHVFLRRGLTGDLVPAELRDGIGNVELEHWEHNWRPYLLERARTMTSQGVPFAQLPQQLHWDWRDKATAAEMLLAKRGFAVRCDDMTQGLMLVALVSDARIAEQIGKPVVYVDYLETAPWNQVKHQNPPRYRGCGVLLIRTAITLSQEEGFRGRIGLHALPQSNAFYRDVCGMTDLGEDAAKRMRYFEMTSEQAQTFLGITR